MVLLHQNYPAQIADPDQDALPAGVCSGFTVDRHRSAGQFRDLYYATSKATSYH